MSITRFSQAAVASLHPHLANAHTHTKKQIAQIARSIEQLGFISPIIVDENNVILAGHGRWLAAKQLGLEVVPIAVVRGLSELQKRAYLLADNKLVENAGWDLDLLSIELKALIPDLTNAGLDIELTGFKPFEIRSLTTELSDSEADSDDEPPLFRGEQVTRRGDLWSLGRHRLLCGNAADSADVARLMGDKSAAMVIIDPGSQFTSVVAEIFSLAVKHSVKGAIHFVFAPFTRLREMLDAGETVYGASKDMVAWAKGKAVPGSFYSSQYELIFVFQNGDGSPRGTLKPRARRRSNLWKYAGGNGFGGDRPDRPTLPQYSKPVRLVADAMRDCSRKGDVVLDPFVGTGATILAAERVGRCGYGLEFDPSLVDVAIRRWQALTKQPAILVGADATFDEVTARRSPSQGGRGK
jgi:hypothetical protein